MLKKISIIISTIWIGICIPFLVNSQNENFDKQVNEAAIYPELSVYLNSKDYQNIRTDSVYIPIMNDVYFNDTRIAHLIDNNGQPINPFEENYSSRKFKDGGTDIPYENLVPLSIDFVEIYGKVYYRLFFDAASLSRFIPSELIDYENYPGFILIEIMSDINLLADQYRRNGADSVVMTSENSFRVYKPLENLNNSIPFEADQIGRKDYPGFFTYARLENAPYLPLKNKYPTNRHEEKSKRTTNSRHFVMEDGSIQANLTMRPTSYPILPESGDYKLENMSNEQRSKIKWIELPASYPTPVMSAAKATYTTYFDETLYGHSVFCTADEPSPYVWICAPADGNYISTVGALEDDDTFSADEHNFDRIHEKFDITSIPDCATVNSAQFENYLPDIAPFVTGDCDGLIRWEEVGPVTKDMYQNMLPAHNVNTNGDVDTYSYTWFNDVEDGLVFFVDDAWDWDRADLYTGWDVDFNSLGLDDIESQLASNWYVVGIADKDENNQSPIFWEAVANYGYYANFRINYTTHPNDLCTEAVVISSFPYSSGVVSNSCAQTETMPTLGCFGTTGATVWYTFTGTGNRMELSTDYAGTSLDTEIHLLSGTCGTLTEVACDDDSGDLGMSSELYFCSTLGTTYFVTVGHYSSNSYGNYQFSVIDFPVEVPTAVSADNSTICIGNNTNLNATPGINGEEVHWYTSSCGGTFVGNGTTINVQPATTTTYYARTYDTDCLVYSSSCTSVTVTVDPQPTATAGGSQSICINSTATVSGASAANGTISWTENGAGSITSGATTLTPVYTPAAGDAGNSVTLTMTVTSTNACAPQTATATYTVTVDPLPSATAGGSETICINETATVSGATSSNGTIAWTENGAGSITAGANTLSPTYTPAAGDEGNTVTLTMTVTSNNACNPQTATATYTVTVQPLPIASAGGNQSICINETATVSGASSANGTIEWTENGAGSITSGATTLTPTYTPSAGDIGNSVTLTMTVTSNNACNPQTATAIYTVNVDPLPTASAGGSQTICVNETATVSGATATNGTIAWTENGAGSITSGATTLTPVYTPAPGDAGTTVTLTMTVTSNNECVPFTATATYDVTIEPLPTASAGGNTTICPGADATVSGANATYGTILWTHDGAGTISSGATTLTPTYTSAAVDEGNTVTLTMTVTSNNACNPAIATATYTVFVSDLPTAPVIINSDINNFCETDPGNITLTSTGGIGTTIRWFDDACGGNEIGTTNPLVIASPTATTTYFARNENACGVSDCASKTITVVTPPIAPTLAETDLNNFCSDHSGNIQLSVTGGSGTSLQWFTGSCGGSSIGSGNPLSIPSPENTTEYFARWENACGSSACANVNVQVNAIPIAPVTAQSDRTEFCADDAGNIELSVTGGSGTTVRWFTGSCGGTEIGTGTNLVIASPTITTTYFARWENSCGNSSCAFVTVDVIQLPTIMTNVLSTGNNLCIGDAGTIDISVVGGNGTTLKWFTGSCGGTEIGTGNPLNIASPESTTEYFVRWENSCGTTDCETIIINIIDAPTDPLSASVDINSVCINDAENITLSLNGGEGPVVEWYSGSCGGVPVGTGNPLVIESPMVNTVYFGRYESGCGITNCQSVLVDVIQLPEAPTSASVDRNNFCSYDDENIELTLIGGSGADVHWFTGACGDTEVGIGNPLSIESPETNTTYYGRWENSCGVTVCQNITITVLPSADATINPAGPFCEIDDPVVITAAQLGGTWSGTAINPTTGLFDPEVAGAGEHLISYSITGTCPDDDEITISVIDLFDATITDVDPVCSNSSSFDLIAATAGGTWSGTGITNATDGTFDPSIAGAGIHVITYEFLGTCGSSDQTSITVIQSADATINDAGPLCETGDPIVITAAQVGGTWAGTAISPATGQFDPEVSGPGDFVITYTITGTCGDTDDFTISVIELFDATITDVAPMCSNEPAFDLVAATAGGTWSGTGITNTTNGTFDPTVAGAGNHIITYEYTGLCGNSDQTTITVLQKANATINTAGPFCITDDPVVITAIQAGGTWSGTAINITTGLFDPEAAGIGDHIITYSISGDCGDTQNTTITVLPLFDATITEVASMCTGDATITLTAATAGGTWSGTGITDTENGTFAPSVAGAGNHVITYTYSGNCGSSDNITITVAPSADATITPTGPFCIDYDPVVLQAAQIGGTWSGTAVNPANGFFDPEVAGAGEHVITYTITGACGDSDVIAVSVLEYFDATITTSPTQCFADSSVVLTANTVGGIWEGNGIYLIEEQYEYWFYVDGPGEHQIIYHYDGLCGGADTILINLIERADASFFVTDTLFENDAPVTIVTTQEGGVWTGDYIPVSNIFDPTISGLGDFEIIYTIESIGNRCNDSDTVTISVLKTPIVDLLVSNVITPDADGFNDRWKIQGIEAFDNVSIRIFTRWGDEIFVFDGTGAQYADPSYQWDGKHNDRELPSGSYLYILTLGDNDNYKGTISLIR
jgi:gliding motility-associated-like protein